MFIVALTLIGGLGVGYATGGRLGNVQHAHLRRAWLVGVALGLQLIAFPPIGPRLSPGVVAALYLISYAALLVFAVSNLHSLGIAIASLGVVCNALVIAANGGYMPARRAALASAGKLFTGATDVNSRLIDGSTRFALLGDVFAVPRGMPLANVFSIGDLLIAAGVAVLIVLSMHLHTGYAQAEEAA